MKKKSFYLAALIDHDNDEFIILKCSCFKFSDECKQHTVSAADVLRGLACDVFI